MKVRCARCGKEWSIIFKQTKGGAYGHFYPKPPTVWICEWPCRASILYGDEPLGSPWREK